MTTRLQSTYGIRPTLYGNSVAIGTFLTIFKDDITPSGCFDCNGQAISRTDYPELYTKFGTYFGEGDGSTTFNLPNFISADTKLVVKAKNIDIGSAVNADTLGGLTADSYALKTDLSSYYTGAQCDAKYAPLASPAFTGTTKTYGGYLQSVLSSANDITAGFTATPTDCRVASSYGTTGSFVPLTFYTSDILRMMISISGNVGMGTTAPDSKAKLHLSDASYGGIMLERTGIYASKWLINPSHVHPGDLVFENELNAAYRPLTLKENNVGIAGVVNPQANLHSAGSTILGLNGGLGDVAIQNEALQMYLASNTQLILRVRGTDGVLRQSIITLA